MGRTFSSDWKDLVKLAAEVQVLLIKHDKKLVLAESCTGGMAAAALCSLPGISANFCGSSVVYRDETKANWLGISRKILEDETAVSDTVAQAMAAHLLRHTPEADIAAAVTGYLGPDAPEHLDGVVIGATAVRQASPQSETFPRLARISRSQRQTLASLSLLQMVRSLLSHP